MGRRFALLLAAVLVAALGTALVFAYVHNADNRALADQKPTLVMVAKVAIAPGTRVIDAANGGAFEQKKEAKDAIPPNALSSIDPVKDEVVTTTIFPGQALVAGMFGATAANNGSITIPPGDVAVSFQFADPNRVAGFVQPGSNVAVFSSYNNPNQTGPAARGVKILLPKVTVIAVGPTTITPPVDKTEANPESLPRAILTLAVSQQQAEKLIFAQAVNGQILYLGLLNDQSKIVPEGPNHAGINGNSVFG